MSSKRQYLVFLIIPAAVFIIILKLNEAFGQYYFNPNSDPSYLYLINSLDVAILQPVHHVDNPGTTVQVLGGIVIKALAFFRGENDMERDVLLNPEMYLAAINKTLFAINILAIAVLGSVAFHLTKNVWLSLLLQGGVFSSWLTIKAMLMVSPEPVSVLTGVIFIILIVWSVERGTYVKKPGPCAILFSIATAFGLATKLTFIPFIIIPLVILPSVKWKAIYLLLTALVFHVFLIPAYAHYDFFLLWVKMLLMNTQPYGQGTPEIIDIDDASLNLVKLVIVEHTFFIALFFSIGMLLFIFTNKKIRSETGRSPSVKLLTGVTLAVVFHTLMVSKNYNPRYFIPSLSLFTAILYLNIKVYRHLDLAHPPRIHKLVLLKALLVVVAVSLLYIRHFIGYNNGDTLPEWMHSVSHYSAFSEWFENTFLPNVHWLLGFIILFVSGLYLIMDYTKIPHSKLNKSLTVCLALITAAYQFRQIDIPGFYHCCEHSKKEAMRVIDFVERECGDCIKICGEKSSSKYYALKYGTSTNFTQQDQLESMKELYRDEKIYFWGLKVGDREFEDWMGKFPLADILKQGGSVILWGDFKNLTSTNINKIETENNVKLDQIFKGELEVVYRVSGQ